MPECLVISHSRDLDASFSICKLILITYLNYTVTLLQKNQNYTVTLLQDFQNYTVTLLQKNSNYTVTLLQKSCIFAGQTKESNLDKLLI